MTRTVPPTPDIKAGDYVKIPKGASYSENYGRVFDKTVSRDAVAKVYSIEPIYDYSKPHKEMISRNCWSNGYEQTGWAVSWVTGGQSRYIKVEDVTITSAPAPKAAPTKPKALTLRQLMAPGSVWKVTKEIPVKHAVSYDKLVVREHLPVDFEFEVKNKFTTYGPGFTEGLWLTLDLTAPKRRIQLALSDMKDCIEMVKAADPVDVFYIYDTAKKEYYSGYDYDYKKSGFMDITYSKTLPKAKVFKRLADVRAHLLVQTGYYDNLPEAWGSVPEWMQGRKMFDIPRTWVIRKFDKVTKAQLDEIECIETFDRTWRLRALTIQYGSAVRQIYSELEKKNKLDEFSAVVAFGVDVDDKHYWYREELTESEKAEIAAALECFNPKDIRKAKGAVQQAIAVKDAATAMMVKLSYDGNLKLAVIDLKQMSEVV